MYKGSSTTVKSMCGITEDFNVGVGVHQGLALSFTCSLMILFW